MNKINVIKDDKCIITISNITQILPKYKKFYVKMWIVSEISRIYKVYTHIYNYNIEIFVNFTGILISYVLFQQVYEWKLKYFYQVGCIIRSFNEKFWKQYANILVESLIIIQ